jgi:heptosyltransferase-1
LSLIYRVCWLANGNFTIGVDDPREGARAFYDLAVPRPAPTAHAVEWYLEVLRHLKVPVHNRFTWLPPRYETAKAIRHKWPVDSHRWIVVQPGARWETKRWPAAHFSRSVQRLAQTLPDFHFAIMGAPADAQIAADVTRSNPGRCLDLTGKTSLPEMIEWLRASELMLTNDTGPMHVAAALGRPVVGIFGPTNPKRTGPFGQLNNVLQSSLDCVPCLQEHCRRPTHLECMWSITPESVCERVERMLGKSDTSPFRS